MSTEENFKINLNQNLWGLLVSYLALGLAEFHDLETLKGFSAILAIVMTLSAIITTIAYTIRYVKNKNESKDGKKSARR